MTLKPRPPEMREQRILRNPFELALSIAFVMAGIGSAQTLLTWPAGQPRVGLMALPAPLLWVWIAMLLLGGVLTVAGLCMSTFRVWGRAVERVGLWLNLASWSMLGLATATTGPVPWYAWAQYIAFSFGCVLRLYALWRLERAVTVAVEAHEQQADATADKNGVGK